MTVLLPLLLLSGTTAHPVRPADPAGPLLPLTFDLQHRPVPEPDLELPAAEDAGNPLALSVLDDERQRLRLGIAPGGGARLGLSYRLTLGD